MSDDYSIKALEEKYDGMTVERLNAMTSEERGTYYADLYQYVGRLIGLLVEVDGVNSLKGQAEHFIYGAAGCAHRGLLDALAALVSLQD